MCKSNVIPDTTEKGTVELNNQHDGSDTYAARNVQIGTPQFLVDQNPRNESSSVNETIEISDISQEDPCQPAKNDNAPTKYFVLPGNKDTVMVEFPKVTCTETITDTKTNELNNIAQQYASKEDVTDQNSEENQDNQIPDSSEIADQSSDNVQSTSLEVSNNVNETFIQPIANGKQMFLDQNGQLKEIVYQEMFTGQTITSVLEATTIGSKLAKKIGNDIGDEGDKNSSSKVLDKSTTESTSNDGDNSTEITASSEATTNSTTTESNVNTHGHENTTNNTKTGEATSNDDNRQHEDSDDAEPCNVEGNSNESEPSDDGMAPPGDDISNEELLLRSQSDNPELPIDPAREKALLDDSSLNSSDEHSEVSSNKKKKALLSPNAHNCKRKHHVNIISSDGKYDLTFLPMKPDNTLHINLAVKLSI